MSKVMFGARKLANLKKEGVIKPDDDGYYTLVVGALECYNSIGAFYTIEGVRKLFGPGSIIERRVANGCLRAEVNHPEWTSTMSEKDYVKRMLHIDMGNTCAHFRKIWLDENFGKNHPEYGNPNLIAIMAEVKPAGDKKHILQEALDNKYENVCFSIRATADEVMIRGKMVRVLTDVLAIDFVNEGGISVASKWDSPATESITEADAVRLTERILKKVAEESKSMAMESSAEAASYLMTRHFKSTTPVYANW